MSSMGELTFFLGLQVKQKPNGIFISQDKYVDEILKKFDFANVKSASTPIETQKEGTSSERLSEAHPTPSPEPTSEAPNESLHDSSSAQSSEVPFEQQPDLSPSPSPRPSPNPSPTPNIPDSIPEHTGENLGDHSFNDTSLSGNEDAMTLQNVYDLCISLCKQVSDQAKEIKLLKAKITKLKRKANPVIKHFKAYQKRISKEQRQQRKSLSKKKKVQIESVSKQGRKNAKGDGKAKENAQSEGRTKEMMDEDKETDEVGLSTEDEVSTAKKGVSTEFEKVSTDRPKLSTDDLKVSTDEQMESNDDQVDASEEIFEGTEDQREGIEEKVESTADKKVSTEEQSKEEIASQASQTSSLTPTSVIFGDDETIATLLINMSKAKAISKEKEKGVELKDVEDTDRPKTTSTRSTLTLKPLPKIDPKDKGKKKIEEEDETESEDDDIPQVVKKFKQLENDEELARKVQEEWEAEEEKNKIAEEEAANEALIKNFDDVKARIEADRILAEKLQEQEREQFTIEERAKFLHDTIAAQRKFLAQQRSQATRNKPPTKNQLRNQMITYLKHVGNFKHSNLKSRKFEDIQALYKNIKRFNEHFISTGSAKDERFIKQLNKKRGGLSKSEVIKEDTKEEVKDEDKDEESTRKRKLEEYLDKTQPDEAKSIEEINLNVVTRSNGQQRHFSVLTSVLSIFDREDLNAVYQLVMNKYQDEMPEGFERVLWGDLMVLFNPDEQDEFWSSQHEWKIIKKKYPLKKEILVQMLNLRLESEEESTMALELIRFIKKNKELSIPEQTATGKGTSNPLMAGESSRHSTSTYVPSSFINEEEKLYLKRAQSMRMKGVDFNTSIPKPLYEEDNKSDSTYNYAPSEGPKASEVLSKKSKKPKSKKTPTETKATSTPKPTEGRNIQLASTRLPLTLEEGTRTLQPLPKGTTIDPKDSVGNKQPIDKGLPSTASDKGTAKTTPPPEGPLRDKDSEGNKTPADMEPIHTPVADPSGTCKPSYEGELDTQPLVLSTYANVQALLLSDDEAQKSEEDILGAGEEMDEDPQAADIAKTRLVQG
ncbi:putative ribonuclease H-like domain-containing protein [Tanacetum coccineum]